MESTKVQSDKVNEELQQLHQHASTSEYAETFREIASRLEPGWSDTDLLPYFYRGLKECIKDELSTRDRPETLEKYVEWPWRSVGKAEGGENGSQFGRMWRKMQGMQSFPR